MAALKHDGTRRSTLRSAGAPKPPNGVSGTRPVDREAPTPRLTGGAVWADHARLLLTKLAHDRMPQAEGFRLRARELAVTFDRWEPKAPDHVVPDQETRRAKLEELFNLSEEVSNYLGE